ncbi:MAG: hypothetical protein RJA57_1381, partial [Bacteroidota bacterium]
MRSLFGKQLLLALAGLLLFQSVSGQLCTGSLGDPVVNIDFGNGTDPGYAYVPSGAYTYTTSSCPGDGFYTITRSSTACFNNTWHTVTDDHTGNGAFLLVNASFTPGDFVLTTVSGLCPNTTYEFSAWVLNILIPTAGIRPDITFSVETAGGAVLNQYNTGGIPGTAAPQWKQYGFFFTTTPGNTSVVLRMRNNAPGGFGNDLALDDISFRPCGPSVTASIAGISDPFRVCIRDQRVYRFTSTLSVGYANPFFQWQQSADTGRSWSDLPGARDDIWLRPVGSAGVYLYRLTVAEGGNESFPGCRIASNTIRIDVVPSPLVRAGPDRVVVVGDSIRLQGFAAGDSLSIHWDPPDRLSDPLRLDPELRPDRDRLYRLTASTPLGCTASDETIVKVVGDLYVPTAFTPNGDGRNDQWTIPYLDVLSGARVQVYNRYGRCVYETVAGVVRWDGKVNGEPQSTGVYVYQIRFADGR